MCYVGPDGENWPHEMCQTCGMSGWVDMEIRPAEPEKKFRVIAGDAYEVVPGAPFETTITSFPVWSFASVTW